MNYQIRQGPSMPIRDQQSNWYIAGAGETIALSSRNRKRRKTTVRLGSCGASGKPGERHEADRAQAADLNLSLLPMVEP